MEQNIAARQAMKPLRRLEELPIELLVYIFSLFSTSRDLVRLRYVSRKIRSISETSTLWKNFLWPWYDSREERSVNEVLKACGTHIKRLTFPGVSRGMASPTAIQLVQHCCNVTEITLGICLNGDEIQKVVEMKFLRKLEVCWIESVPIEPIIVACSKLEELVLKCEHSTCDLCNTWALNHYICLYKWIDAGFKPPNLNIVNGHVECLCKNLDNRMFVSELLQRWPQWNSEIPAGHTAHFKVFYSWDWWDSSVAFPEFQLEFGQNVIYPFIKPSNFGLFGFGEDLMLLTNSTINGKVIHQLKEPYIRSEEDSLITSRLCCNVGTLNFVTDFDASRCGLLSGHLEQLSVACPNLERLNLKYNRNCLESLKGLRSIVNQCHHLQGLNLDRIHVEGIQNRIQLWELLSEIKMLSRLAMQTCTMKPFEVRDTRARHSFLKLAQKFVCLEYLQLSNNECNPFSSCQYALDEAYPQLLAHFPVLIYCHVIGKPSNVADIITNCKRLKYFGYHFAGYENIPSFLIVAPNQYLQHLRIVSRHSNIGELFMDSVSTHSKLERVFLLVQSVAVSGITALLQNSPKLYICKICPRQIFDEENVEVDLKVFKDTLKNKFSHRKLFNLNGFTLTRDHASIL